MPKQAIPTISICIPVFNGEDYILNCINSVLEQNFCDYELIIIDNFSTDNTKKIIKNIKDKRIRYIKNSRNIGSIPNFNKCIKEAKGTFFLLLPHDDLLLPNCLEICLRKFDEPKVGFTYSSIRAIDEKGNIKFTKVNHSENKLFTPEETLTDIINNFVPIQLAMVRTSILKRLNGFEIEFGLFCDVHLWLKIAFEGWSSAYHSAPFSCHRVHAQQGQNAFLNSDFKTLSKHWGKKLDRSFFIKNSFNGLFLKLINFYLQKSLANGYEIKKQNIFLLKLFIKHHLRSILTAFFRLDGFIIFHEFLLIKSLLKIYSLKKLTLYYPCIIFDEVKKKLIKKFSLRS